MKPDQLDFNRVAMFVQIAEAGGVNAAAARLKIPKSSVSRALTQLEKELGVELVVRHSGNRQFELTEAGRAFFDSASNALASVTSAREGIRRDTHTPRGLLRVAAPPALATWVVAPFIARFVRQYPEVDVELTTTTRKNLSPMRDGFDVILSHSDQPSGQLKDSSAKARALGSVNGGLFASETYLRERGTPRRPADLARHDCILQTPAKEKGRWSLMNAQGVVEEVSVTGHIRVDDIFTATSSAVANGGIAILPTHSGQVDPFAKSLIRVLPNYIIRGDAAYLLYSPSSHVPLRVKLFVDALAETCGHTCTAHNQAADDRAAAAGKKNPKKANGVAPAALS